MNNLVEQSILQKKKQMSNNKWRPLSCTLQDALHEQERNSEEIRNFNTKTKSPQFIRKKWFCSILIISQRILFIHVVTKVRYFLFCRLCQAVMDTFGSVSTVSPLTFIAEQTQVRTSSYFCLYVCVCVKGGGSCWSSVTTDIWHSSVLPLVPQTGIEERRGQCVVVLKRKKQKGSWKSQAVPMIPGNTLIRRVPDF